MRIHFQPVQREDLPEVVSQRETDNITDSPKVKAQRAAFDQYQKVEQGEFSEERRLRNHIHRISRYQFGSGSRCVKACDTATGELLGAAVWILPGVNKVLMTLDPIGATGGNREKDEDVAACESLNVELWNEFWGADDRSRNAIMKGEDHLCVCAPIDS